MKIMQLSKRKGETGGAPRQAHLMGEPHMLAYINEAERQMLKRAGGAEAPGPEGIPVYGFWGDVWSEITSGGKAQTETFNSGSSNNSSSLPKTSTSTANANKQAAESMKSVGVTGLSGTNGHATDNDDEPYNAGNPPIMEYDGSTGQYTVVGGLDPNKPIEMATNEDGTYYQANNNPENVQNTLATALGVQTGNTSGMVVNDGNGGYVTTGGDAVDGGYDLTGGTLNDTAGDNSTTTTTTPVVVDDTPSTPAPPPVNQALLDALARRDAALSTQMGNIGTAFGFSNDDYYNQLGTDYREGGLSEAFTTAYDDATRGIYDTFKSAGMLTQQGVDDSMGILASAEGGEEGRIDDIVNQYITANRNFVNDGRTGMEGTLQGFVSETEDIPTIDAQTAQILGYDVAGNSQPFKTPKEQEVVDFFTDFVKRSYDPSYNVDPTAVASGGPSRVSGSVDQLGAGTQPSTIAGILDPIAGGSVKVIG